MIKKIRVAYAIGFSSSICTTSFSAYADAAKWTFSKENERRLILAFCRGWAEGYKIASTIKVDL